MNLFKSNGLLEFTLKLTLANPKIADIDAIKCNPQRITTTSTAFEFTLNSFFVTKNSKTPKMLKNTCINAKDITKSSNGKFLKIFTFKNIRTENLKTD